MSTSAIAAYVLAGGRSSRMGRDKAMLALGGKTLLARAVETLRGVASEVTVLGERQQLEGADRALPDLHSGCGPLGGMEAALRDLASRRTADWACFLPVDMPFLPASLYAALVRHWLDIGVRIGYVQIDGLAQPLVSLIHISVLPYLTAALDAGRFKATSALEAAAKDLSGLSTGSPARNVISFENLESDPPIAACVPSTLHWTPSPQQLASRHLWFSNLNTPEEFAQGEAFLGSTHRS
jgi:molybdenum cofactor guanylyltransferase